MCSYLNISLLSSSSLFLIPSGIENVIQCHGSFASATCMRCKASYTCEDVRSDIFAQIVPKCRKCAQPEPPSSSSELSTEGSSQLERTAIAVQNVNDNPSLTEGASSSTVTASLSPSQQDSSVDVAGRGNQASPENPTGASPSRPPTSTESDALALNLPANVIKPDIVFFGESLPDLFHQRMAKDKNVCDLLIVIGSSLKVRPVALIPSSISPKVPQVHLRVSVCFQTFHHE